MQPFFTILAALLFGSFLWRQIQRFFNKNWRFFLQITWSHCLPSSVAIFGNLSRIWLLLTPFGYQNFLFGYLFFLATFLATFRNWQKNCLNRFRTSLKPDSKMHQHFMNLTCEKTVVELIYNLFGNIHLNAPSQFEWFGTSSEQVWNLSNQFRTGLEPVLNSFFCLFLKVAKKVAKLQVWLMTWAKSLN